MDQMQKLIKDIAFASQIGLSIITPPVLMALLGWYISNRFSVGAWITVVFILIGLATSFASAYRFYKRAQKRFEKHDNRSEDISFRDHI